MRNKGVRQNLGKVGGMWGGGRAKVPGHARSRPQRECARDRPRDAALLTLVQGDLLVHAITDISMRRWWVLNSQQIFGTIGGFILSGPTNASGLSVVYKEA